MRTTPTSLLTWKYFLEQDADECYFFQKTSPLEGFGRIRYNDEVFDWVDLNDGAIYSNKSAKRLMLIFLEAIITRPCEVVCKISYHLYFPISLPVELFYTLRKEQVRQIDYPWLQKHSKAYLIRRTILRHFADLVRIPYYGALLTVVAIAAVCFYHRLDPNDQLKGMMFFRSLSSRLEREMVWGDQKKCYYKEMQSSDFLHRVPRFCNPNQETDFYVEGLCKLVRMRNQNWNYFKSLSPLSKFLCKTLNLFSHSIV